MCVCPSISLKRPVCRRRCGADKARALSAFKLIQQRTRRNIKSVYYEDFKYVTRRRRRRRRRRTEKGTAARNG